eukprot:GHVH01004173.1.p1 GENE.GHVH01004173.1~~GHVH01004173.1.p1  ORF type:complete len:495 (-),score=71.55 GHVH01004173.1:81-1565(-)
MTEATSPKEVDMTLPYGDRSYTEGGTIRKWTEINELTPEFVAANAGKEVRIRARMDTSRCKGNMGFLKLRYRMDSVQGLILAKDLGEHGKPLNKFAGSIPLESVVDVVGIPSVAQTPVTSCTMSAVELVVSAIFCISRAPERLPFYLKDANAPEEGAPDGTVKVELPTRLDNRILDLRTEASTAIFQIKSEVASLFREFLRSRGFTEIHTPKLLGGSSEGGANIFKLKYFGRDACLAQSPQLYKQMCIQGDMDRVFEVAPVFRAENSNTHRHLTEFTGLDMEMVIKDNYTEALDVMGELFNFIFKGLNERCSKQQALVNKHYNTEPFVWSEKPLRLTYTDGMDMLRADGLDVPADVSQYDLGTEEEKRLGKLVKAKFGTDFYMLIDFPLDVRPFYTMPHPTKPGYSNSYDFMMRGEEIVSGAQRIHDPEQLIERAVCKGMDVATITDYVDSFRLGSLPHAGLGVGLDRVVMLFLGVGNIRRATLFPRDPKRLTP